MQKKKFKWKFSKSTKSYWVWYLFNTVAGPACGLRNLQVCSLLLQFAFIVWQVVFLLSLHFRLILYGFKSLFRSACLAYAYVVIRRLLVLRCEKLCFFRIEPVNLYF